MKTKIVSEQNLNNKSRFTTIMLHIFYGYYAYCEQVNEIKVITVIIVSIFFLGYTLGLKTIWFTGHKFRIK